MSERYITGASGFLGKNLLERLPKQETTSIPHEQIQLTTIKPFDYFYFLSAYGNMAFHDEDDKIIKANLLDLIHVTEQARNYDFKSFVYISTSSVKLKYQTMYSRTKKAAEEVLLSYTEKHGLPFCIVRPYSITGVGEQPKHLIPTIIRSCLYGEQMNFVKEPTHDFVDVSDVVEAIINLSENRGKGIFEVGSGSSYSNQQVLEMVEEITGKKANINQVGRMRDYDNEEWVCKNYRARSFGWMPKKTLKDSIKEMVEYERGVKK